MSHTIRHPYTGAKRFAKSCRHKGGCTYCASNRTIVKRRKDNSVKGELEEMTMEEAYLKARLAIGRDANEAAFQRNWERGGNWPTRKQATEVAEVTDLAEEFTTTYCPIE